MLREIKRTMEFEQLASAMAAASGAKDEFLAVLSHELRTPLTPILGWARMLKQGDTSKIARAAEVIERNALLQIRLVDDLLELTRVARGSVILDVRSCDVDGAVDAAIESFADFARQKGVAIEVVSADRPLTIAADPHRLQQILRNVLSNALKFTPQGGRVTVTAAAIAGAAMIRTRDTGEGIAADFLPAVFDMFRQQDSGTRRSHEGLGIGLALVKRLTEMQGGRVTVASKGPGRGTEVTIEFPLSAGGHPDSIPRKPVLRARDALRGLRILLVEDMDDAREATQLLLEEFGADVVVARDGLDALDALEHTAPDVVLCDLRMPRMDGFEFIEALQDLPGRQSPPVIAVSGLASSADHLRTQTAGFKEHLDKPFDEARLLAVIAAVVDHQEKREP
jgi:CheY-like chemotaxis protein